MNVNSFSETDFQGKVIYDKKMNKQMINYANQILDVVVNGKTGKERIKKATYDLRICNAGSKKTVHPKIFFQSKFYRIGKDNRYIRYSPDLRIDYDKEIGAKRLHKFLNLFENNKNHFKDSYNTWWEKFKTFFK